MLTSLALGGVLLIGFLLLGRWFVAADPKLLIRIGKWLAVVALGVAVILLLVTGRFSIVLTGAMIGLPLILRYLRAGPGIGGAWRNGPAGPGYGGGVSRIRTRFLAMTLDHASGNLDGAVIEGAFSGRRLGQMPLAELLRLLNDCRLSDPYSAQVLEAYLDRVHSSWRAEAAAGGTQEGDAQETTAGKSAGVMTREEAFRVLGLAPSATTEDIQAAYHRLIALLHPDRGGSTFLAAQVNMARDVLLNR